ncbi:MAG: universal stress protein [Nocardioidaceae bacterium]
MTVAVAHQVSATSRKALQEALREARCRGTDLAVLHVVGSIDADTEDAYRAGVADDIEAALSGQEPVTWTLHLATASSDLGAGVMKLADEVGADVLVIGARRRSPVGKALMGSVAQTIILEADMPVLVVKSP